jgi:hypothetical protein
MLSAGRFANDLLEVDCGGGTCTAAGYFATRNGETPGLLETTGLTGRPP